MKTISEGSATIFVSDDSKISRKLEVFYNPVMKKHRDLSVLFLLVASKNNLVIADPLAGSGVRSIRFLKELPKKMISELHVNDLKENFSDSFSSNLSLSGIDLLPKNVFVHNLDANLFLLSSKAFDYVDIDPFGSPNPFLDAACKRVKRDGFLAVTATDTAPLCGTYSKACKRKYNSVPIRNFMMHELGLRILIKKCQVVAAQYDKALTPVFSFYSDHYFRIFFKVVNGKKRVDEILSQIGSFDDGGPFWLGKLWDEDFCLKMLDKSKSLFPSLEKFLTTICDESLIDSVGFFDVHRLSADLKLSVPPKSSLVIKKLIYKGFLASKTHFSGTGIRSDCSKEDIVLVLKELSV